MNDLDIDSEQSGSYNLNSKRLNKTEKTNLTGTWNKVAIESTCWIRAWRKVIQQLRAFVATVDPVCHSGYQRSAIDFC